MIDIHGVRRNTAAVSGNADPRLARLPQGRAECGMCIIVGRKINDLRHLDDEEGRSPAALLHSAYQFMHVLHTPLRRCIREVGVAAVPGSSFFREPVNHLIRMHFARGTDVLDEAVRRLEKLQALLK